MPINKEQIDLMVGLSSFKVFLYVCFSYLYCIGPIQLQTNIHITYTQNNKTNR